MKNVPESNGRVGMIGSSYEGFTVLMALVNPHPALKAAVPESPMVDGWMGDDWFHNGAFRQTNFDYIYGQTTRKGAGQSSPARRLRRLSSCSWRRVRRATSRSTSASISCRSGKKLSEHPAYDEFWQGQALDQMLAAQPLTVPTMFVTSLWDQEDMYGGVHAYAAIEGARTRERQAVFWCSGPGGTAASTATARRSGR